MDPFFQAANIHTVWGMWQMIDPRLSMLHPNACSVLLQGVGPITRITQHLEEFEGMTGHLTVTDNRKTLMSAISCQDN